MLSNSWFFIRTLLFILVSTVIWIALSASAAIDLRESRKSTADPNLAQGLAAWEQVYSVLISPRCINCHTATDYPQQGDDRRRHFANVVRGGPEGKGVPALQCASCHLIKNGVDGTVVEGVEDTHYSISNFHVSAHHPTVNVPVLWWRSVGNTHTAFVMETLIDELSTRAKMDPFAYRRKLLKPEAKKLRAVLDLLDEKTAGWRKNLPRGHAAGIACHESFDTAVACAVDVSIENKRPKIHRATGCGEPPVPVISPAVVNALTRLTGKRYRKLPLKDI